MARLKNGCIAFATLLSVAACSGVEVERNFPKDGVDGKPLRPSQEPEPGLFDGLGLSLGGGDSEGDFANLPVNRYLWRATLDTLAFLPLVSTDPYGGVIVTDWGVTPTAPNERFKVTAYITSATLKPQALRVVVNRQTKDQNGAWLPRATSPQTGRQLEDAILTRARQLRTADADAEKK